MKLRRFESFRFLAQFGFALVVGASVRAHALDAFEYQVYDSEINKVGEYSLETHLNSNLAGKRDPEYVGQIAQDHMTHLTFEFARGMTKYWELGAYLQSALDSEGVYHYAGAKLRSKFVVPHEEGAPLQLGVNFEISNVPPEFEEDRWGSEVRPIIGYTFNRLTVMFNPIVDVNLTSGASAVPDFQPALKVTFDTKRGYGLGAEYYVDMGPIDDLNSASKSEQYIFAAYDLLRGPFELNIALGAGLTESSNSTIAKAIYGFDF
jgi:hypothetical protein